MPGSPHRCGRALLLLVLAWWLGVGAAQAQVSVQPIERVIPDEWRPPLTQFLQELGASNAELILNNTAAVPIGRSDAVLVRFQEQDLCAQDACLTVIGFIRRDGFFPQTMFMAGKWMGRRDTMGQLLGRLIPPPYSLCVSERPGERDCLTLYETPKGWIVSPLMK